MVRADPIVPIKDRVDDVAGRSVGTAMLYGDAVPLVAPAIGGECLCYVVELRLRSGGAVLAREERGGPIAIDDGPGRIVADIGGAFFAAELERSSYWRRCSADDLAMFERLGLAPSWRKVLALVRVIRVGTRVAIWGHGTWELDPFASAGPDGYRGPAPRRYVMAARAYPPVYLSPKKPYLR